MKAVNDLLEQFKERFGKYPNVAQFDEGKEFYNVGARDLLTKNNIEYFSTNSERKAAIVERFNRTLKTSMWKYFYSKGTPTWIDIYLMILRIIIIIPNTERSPFTSEVAGLILSENFLNVTRTQCSTHVKKVCQHVLCRKSWVFSEHSHREVDRVS